MSQPIQIPNNRDMRFYSLTGELPGQIETPAGENMPFNRVLDVSLNGLGLEMERYLDPGTELVLRREEDRIELEVIYSLLLPRQGTYRCGFKTKDKTINVVKFFIEHECFHLVPIDEDLFYKLLRKSSAV